MVFLGREIQSIFQPRQQPGGLVLNHPHSFSVSAPDRLTKKTGQDMTKSLHVSVVTNNRIHESIPNSTLTGFPKNLHWQQRHKHRFRCQDQPFVLKQIQISNDTNASSSIKLLCFIMTHSGNHRTRIASIQETWGQNCDKLVVASNITDELMGAIAMSSEATYKGLWNKLNETLHYLYRHYHTGQYNWIFKADDDTYVIVENLKTYLAQETARIIQREEEVQQQEIPLIFGRRYSSPRYRNLERRLVYFGNPLNADFKTRFYTKMNGNDPVIYNYGGSGYAMNWNFVERFLQIMTGPDTLRGTPPEDQGLGVVMAYHNIWPRPTRDALGRERFHPEPPEFIYAMPDKYFRLWNDNHRATGGISIGPNCCSTESISFHHIQPVEMRKLHYYLYQCKNGLVEPIN